MNLLHDLHELQARHGWLSDAVLRDYAEASGTPLFRLQEVTSFYPHFRRAPPPRATVGVCRDGACHLAGAPALERALRDELAAQPDVEVRAVSCLGRCEHAPAACVNDTPVPGLDAAAIAALAQGRAPLPPDEPTGTPRRWPSDPYASRSEHYGVLRRHLDDPAGARARIPQVLTEAGLKGMGGAGFPTGLKWRLVRDSKTPGERWAVVNADESEPGTFKDRVILEELPHLVIEGLLLGALVAGAARAVVFIRHEYTREAKAIAREIQRVERLGLLPRLGVALSLFVSPGGYILGEETALLEALEGKRGEPRNKPPYPTDHGVHGRPTLMNNVETFAFVPLILSEGPAAWKAHGVHGGEGWKYFSLCGDVRRPGVYCVPMGTTVRELVEGPGGGMRADRPMAAFCPGGASAPFLPAARADTPLDFEPMKAAGSMLGSGAVLVVEEGRDLFDLGVNLVRFFRNESCGKCVPCRVGSQKAVDLLERVQRGEAGAEALALLPELDETLRLTSICGLGQVALVPALSVIEHFPGSVPPHARGG